MIQHDEEDKASRQPTDASDSSSNGSDSESEVEVSDASSVEWLATTRAKRSTAGNRMKSMLANEEAAADDSDLELLFAEDADDVGFTDVEADGVDVPMDSSSDEEDQEDGQDDLEGENELERQAREKRSAQRKRKAQDAIPAKFRKKVRIADTSTTSPATPPRPKKKSERHSWLPTEADMPTRASQRRTTKLSKEQLHDKMRKDDMRRKKQAEQAEKRTKKLEAMKKPPMTQEERLAEAAVVEKKNSKSLNRWEEAEKQREEERMKKIAALNNRKLDGPVVTFWSRVQELAESQQHHVGKMVFMEEKTVRRKKQDPAAAAQVRQLEAGATSKSDTVQSLAVPNAVTSATPPVGPPPAGAMAPSTMPPPCTAILAAPVLAPPLGMASSINGIQMPRLGSPASTVLALPNTSHAPSPLSYPSSTLAAPATSPLQLTRPKAAPNESDAPHEVSNEPPFEGKVTRHYIILQNFDENAIKDKQVQTQILFGRKMNKITAPKKHVQLCAITNKPAKYRDVKTGLPYANTYAFKEIQRLLRGDYKWSSLVGAWVGSGNIAARGVPDWFLDPSKARANASEARLVPIEDAEWHGQKGKAVEEAGSHTSFVARVAQAGEP